MSEQAQQPQLFEVESILARRKSGRKAEYKIKWKGFSESQATWEPLRNLKGLEDVIQNYERERVKVYQMNQSLQQEPFQAFQTQEISKQHQETMIDNGVHNQHEPNTNLPCLQNADLTVLNLNGHQYQSKEKCQQGFSQGNYFTQRDSRFLNDSFTFLPTKNDQFSASQQPPLAKTQEPPIESHSVDMQLQSKRLHRNLSNLAAKLGHRFSNPEPVSKRTRKKEKIETKQKKHPKEERLNKTYDLEPKKSNQPQKRKPNNRKQTQNGKGFKKCGNDLEREIKDKLVSKIFPKIEDNLRHLPTTFSSRPEQKKDSHREIQSIRGLEKLQLAEAECLVRYSDQSLRVLTLSQLSRQYPQEVLKYLCRQSTPTSS